MSGPDDYRCHFCAELVLYRRDHHPECVYYVNPHPFVENREN